MNINTNYNGDVPEGEQVLKVLPQGQLLVRKDGSYFIREDNIYRGIDEKYDPDYVLLMIKEDKKKRGAL